MSDTPTFLIATMAKAIRRLERADIELKRAIASGEQPRQANAGTSYALAKFNLFKLIKK